MNNAWKYEGNDEKAMQLENVLAKDRTMCIFKSKARATSNDVVLMFKP